MEVARSRLAERTAEAGIKLRQSYARTGPRLHRQAGRCAHARQYKSMRRVIKRRQAVEQSIDHLKADHRMRRNWLKGARGDAMNPILEAAYFNIRCLLRWLVVFRPRMLSGVLLLLDKSGSDARLNLYIASA